MHDADELATQQMAAGFARWTNLSETTFLSANGRARGLSGADLHMPASKSRLPAIPRSDRPMPGWRQAASPRTPECLVQQCGAGLIRVRRDGTRLAFAAPPLIRAGESRGRGLMEITAILSIDRNQLVDAQWSDNGPG